MKNFKIYKNSCEKYKIYMLKRTYYVIASFCLTLGASVLVSCESKEPNIDKTDSLSTKFSNSNASILDEATTEKNIKSYKLLLQKKQPEEKYSFFLNENLDYISSISENDYRKSLVLKKDNKY